MYVTNVGVGGCGHISIDSNEVVAIIGIVWKRINVHNGDLDITMCAALECVDDFV
jgi:hypothetical protein